MIDEIFEQFNILKSFDLESDRKIYSSENLQCDKKQ
jgi:hypothetical protein